MINVVILQGRLTADPELKTTQAGKLVCSFRVAVQRKKYSDDPPLADFFEIVTWSALAEFVSHNFRKGDQIGIEGNLRENKFTDRDGRNRTYTNVTAINVHFIGGKRRYETYPDDDPFDETNFLWGEK